jgi:enoyl-CoA hydratase/carnithine racemase
MNDATVHLNTLADGVVELRLERPPVNALNPAYLADVERAAGTLEADSSVRAVVLTGTGRSLCAGMDLKELLAFTAGDQRAMVHALNTCYARLYGLSKPLVAAAHGAAIAGGLFFVLVSDYRIAGERAAFGLAEVRVGVRFPVGPLAIARAELSPAALRRFMLGGANHDAATALALGVVDEVTATEQVLTRAVAVAREYAVLPAQTFASIKRQIRGEVLDRIERAGGDGDPMATGWFTEETYVATRAVLASLAR